MQITTLERRSGFGVEPLGYMTLKQICYEQDMSQTVFDFMLLIESEFLRIKREDAQADREEKKKSKPQKGGRRK